MAKQEVVHANEFLKRSFFTYLHSLINSILNTKGKVKLTRQVKSR